MNNFINYLDLIKDNETLRNSFLKYLEVFEDDMKVKDCYRSIHKLKKQATTKGNLENIIMSSGISNRDISIVDKRLCRAFENFVAAEEMNRQENEIEKNFFFLKYVKKRRNETLFFQTVHKSYSRLKKEKKNSRTSMWKFYIDNEHYFHPSVEKGEKSSEEINVEKLSSSLDEFYVLNKKKIMLESMAISRATKKEFNIALQEEIKFFPEIKNNLLDVLYNKNIKLFENFNIEELLEIKEIVFSNSSLFQENDLMFLTNSLLNHAAFGINQSYGRIVNEENINLIQEHKNELKGFKKEYLDILSWEFSQKRVLAKSYGYINHPIFLSFINIASDLGDIKLASNFCRQNLKYISKDIRPIVEALSHGRMYLAKGNLIKAFKQIENIDFKNQSFELAISMRSLRLKILTIAFLEGVDLCPNGNEPKVIKEINLYRTFLTRSKTKFSDQNPRIKRNLNFVNLSSKLVRSTSKSAVKRKEMVFSFVKKIKLNTVFKSWVIKMITN